jgi:transposase
MWKPYLEMIALHCPNALNILDRFHIVAKMNKAIDEVRADETRRMTRDGYEPVLKKSRWCLLKRQENLTDKQRLRLRDLLQYNLRTVRAWLLKEEFQQLWDYISPVWAGKFLDQWCTQVMRSRIALWRPNSRPPCPILPFVNENPLSRRTIALRPLPRSSLPSKPQRLP